MKLSDAGQKVFDARYAQRDDCGNVVETFEQAVCRLAGAAAKAEKNDRGKWEEEFAIIIGGLYFVPSTPIWANMGKADRPWQPGACFVLAVEDSLESMYLTLMDTAMVFKSGGGVGYNFSMIRPKGTLVRSTKGKASGVVELIKLYDASSNMVMQGGVRRGASMGILNIDHPEIEAFIRAKLNGGFSNFNLSAGVTGEFMEALEKDGEWPLSFEGKVYKTVRAIDLWNMIALAAHACGDPGIVFIDRLQEKNPIPGKMVNSTNPCGEQPLSPGESCLLGSVNLARMTVPGRSGQDVLDRELLEKTVYTSIRFLDNLIDVAEYPLPLIAEATRATRKVGLGFTGLHDVLILAGLPYDSEEGRDFAGKITKCMQEAAHAASRELAKEKGVFPEWDHSIYYPEEPRRNAACITIAPTGSVTTMAGCEGYGVEPIFAVAYTKSTNVAGDFEVFSPLFLEACKKHGVTQEVMSEVARKGTCQGIPGVPVEIAAVFKGAQDISPEDHILMQAAVQKFVDNAVSKCLAKGTLVQTNFGVLPVEELGNARGEDVFGEPLLGLQVLDGNGEWKKVTAHYSGGKKETRRVRFNNGLIIEGSHTHRLMTSTGWKALKNIAPGDYVKCRFTDYGDRQGGLAIDKNAVKCCQITNNNKITIPEYMSEDLALFLGMFVADGSTTESSGCVALTCADKTVGKLYIDLCERLFNVEPKIVSDIRRPNVKSIRITSRILVRWLETLIGKGCRNKFVPKQILGGSPAEQKAFIRGVTLDGYLKRRDNRSELVLFEGYAKAVVDGISAMLYSMNVAPYIGVKKVINGERTFSVVIDVRIVDAIEKHKNNIIYAKDKIVAVPDDVYTMKLPCSHSEYRNLLYLKREKPFIARGSVLDKLEANYDKNIYFVKVTSVGKGFEEVYDIEVEGSHTYIVSGVVSHNTINLPNTATVEDIDRCYRLAYALELKGITVFRDGCKKGTVTVGKAGSEPGDLAGQKNLKRGEILPRPVSAHGMTHRLDTGCGKIYLTVNYQPDSGEILETFITTGSDGGCLVYTEAASRLVSLAIRGGIPVEEIIGQLVSTHSCPSYMMARGKGKELSPGKSCASAIARKLADIREKLSNGCNGQSTQKQLKEGQLICECGEPLYMAEGCLVCRNCGFSKC